MKQQINSQITSGSAMVIKPVNATTGGKKPIARRGGDLRAK